MWKVKLKKHIYAWGLLFYMEEHSISSNNKREKLSKIWGTQPNEFNAYSRYCIIWELVQKTSYQQAASPLHPCCHTVCLTIETFLQPFLEFLELIFQTFYHHEAAYFSLTLSYSPFIYFFLGDVSVDKTVDPIVPSWQYNVKRICKSTHVFFPDTLQHFSSLHKIPHCLHSLLTLLFATHGMEFYLSCSQLKTICWSIFFCLFIYFVIIASLPNETVQLFNLF